MHVGVSHPSSIAALCWPAGLRRGLAAFGVIALLLAPSARGVAQDDAAERARMVEVIARHAKSAPQALPGGEIAPQVMEVMRQVPRHAFVAEERRDLAYSDRPLPIGHGQTISQPFIVALMTHLLEPQAGDVVLEIGTGSGYQAAVLSPLVRRVCSIEIIPGLGESASERLERLGYANVQTRIGDGYHGWPDCGPFDGIVVTAASSHVPPPLVAQLKPFGRMVIPVGGPFALQQLTLVTKLPDGGVTTLQVLPVQFVPFTRREP